MKIMKLHKVVYLSSSSSDKRITNPMIPWIIAEIKKKNHQEKVKIGVEDGFLFVYESWENKSKLMFQHEIRLISRLAFLNGDVATFFYALRDINDCMVECYAYVSQPDEVMELFSAMKENSHKTLQSTGRSLSNAQTLTSLCADISPNTSHFFEVFYVGKIRVSQKKVPSTFIDDALEKFRLHELEKSKKSNSTNSSRRGSHIIASDQNSSIYVSDSRRGSMTVLSPGNENFYTSSIESEKYIKNSDLLSSRSESINYPVRKNENNKQNCYVGEESNRTMVFQIGKSDLHLISPDRKQILLHKHLKDVVNCVKGNRNNFHFGFTCRDSSSTENCIGYIFKCESESVANELVTAINLAHNNTNGVIKKEKQIIVSCEHCPMVWFHKLCSDVENLNEHKVQSVIFKMLEMLPDEEQEVVLTKLHGLETLNKINLKEQNELLMMVLRTHCESKQSKHVHDSAENRHEFLNQYLGGSTIFMKAKRSLTSSFDQLLKRRSSKDDFGIVAATKDTSSSNGSFKESSTKSISNISSSQNYIPKTITDKSGPILAQTKSHSSPASMMNMFLKVGQSPKSLSISDNDSDEQNELYPGSWRQAIFKNVVTPNKQVNNNQIVKRKLDKDDLRELWRKAINQQILLIRMEKENTKLKERQEEATVKRIKLEYDDIGSSAREYLDVWETIVNKENRKYDAKMLRQAIRQGVPRSKRGDVWIFFAELYCNTTAPPIIDQEKFPNFNVPYEKLLKQLTKFQHAILIDLGRTFPNHTYFMSPFGPGQLALYNLLKAYSLLDPEVGYCQGLCFIAGVLLLHMTEEQAFMMLKHIMFRRSLRKQYLPDMAALQVQLYQLSRLLHDHLPDLYAHFDNCDISPTLYAAPWFLTIFASQFPLGFVSRIFDILLFEQMDVMFCIILSLLTYHKDNLLSCDGMEQIMTYIKNDIPVVNKEIIDKIIKQVFTVDIAKQLMEYGVEYHVLQEELSTPKPEIKKIKHLEEINKNLVQQNKMLNEQLEISITNNSRLETNRSSTIATINRLESEVKSLELSVSTLGNFVLELAYSNSDIEIPSEVLSLISHINICRNQNNLISGKLELENLSSQIMPTTKKQISDSKCVIENKSKEKYPKHKKRSLLKVTESSFDLLTPQSNSIHFEEMHPLDSRDVNICYSGTTELRTIKPISSNRDNNFSLPSIVTDDFEKSSKKCNSINLDSSTIYKG
ncbi:TBC1 domain family member 1 isoform X2 [Daktulosphaira vitifoliae]|uniref:TBC1 domain family member 1 isoform X2 n=1 Tax=Daktulosphaira vitifoliae TaxID=58002 RepID=UPI0021A9E8AF|nr:TBC1 domain family member 1 isoform X2 [Daktulosphaira vitifoliae]